VAIYSSVRAEIGEDKSANPGYAAARSGRAMSELTHRGTMSATEGQIENVDVVSTYIPIFAGDGRVESVFELYSDVTEAVADVRRTTLRITVVLVLVFALLYAILLAIVGHADRILQRQYRDLVASDAQIKTKNRELELEIANRRQVETALRKSEEAAAAASQAKSEFLSSTSHELRTPMNAILGFAQLLESEPGTTLNAAQRTFIREILKAGRHLLELINEVLDLARIEAGKMTLSVEPVSLGALVAECMPLIQNMAKDAGVALSRTEALGEARVMADYMRLKQALLNLLSNAVKYNREGGEVMVGFAPAGQARVRISVTDTGYGIPASEQAGLFQPFHRLAFNPAQAEGTGIGLALTRSLVTAMGGQIGFRSEWCKGSTFWIELPAAPAEAAQSVVAHEADSKLPEPGANAALRSLLYIEDNPANVLLMEQIARRLSMRFMSAHNAELGIALAASERPDLIVMDINLPQMDGYEAFARLKRDPLTAPIPVMALTANAMSKDVARGLAAGFVRYETKPIDVEAMMRSIGEVLGQAQ
jgi:signal transduction histidine kinase/ActR/RegA family two-component response regulator